MKTERPKQTIRRPQTSCARHPILATSSGVPRQDLCSCCRHSATLRECKANAHIFLYTYMCTYTQAPLLHIKGQNVMWCLPNSFYIWWKMYPWIFISIRFCVPWSASPSFQLWLHSELGASSSYSYSRLLFLIVSPHSLLYVKSGTLREEGGGPTPGRSWGQRPHRCWRQRGRSATKHVDQCGKRGFRNCEFSCVARSQCYS